MSTSHNSAIPVQSAMKNDRSLAPEDTKCTPDSHATKTDTRPTIASADDDQPGSSTPQPVFEDEHHDGCQRIGAEPDDAGLAESIATHGSGPSRELVCRVLR